MSTQKTIAEIIQIAKISITLSANKVGENNGINGLSPDKWIPRKILLELRAVEYLYNNYPNETYTRNSANYLYDLCFPYNKQAETIIDNLAGAPPVVTGPINATVAAGSTASFTVSVTSTTAYTVQWYRNSVLIVGAINNTYSFTASIADSGAVFTARVTNAAGSALSQNGILTVTTALVGKYYVGDTDYSANLLIGFDNVVWNVDFNIAGAGQPLQIQLPSSGDLGNNRYHVCRYPKSLGVYNGAWSGGAQNFGPSIPDQAWLEIIEIGDYKYIISRGQISVDIAAGMTFNLGS